MYLKAQYCLIIMNTYSRPFKTGTGSPMIYCLYVFNVWVSSPPVPALCDPMVCNFGHSVYGTCLYGSSLDLCPVLDTPHFISVGCAACVFWSVLQRDCGR